MSEIKFREVPLAALCDIIGVHRDCARGWIARNPTKYQGERRGRALWFSAREVLFYGLTKHLIDNGAPVQVALGLAEQHVDSMPEDGREPDAVLMYLREPITGDHALYTYVHAIHETAGPLSYSLVYVGRLWRVIVNSLAKAEAA